MAHALLLSPDDQAVSAITGVLEEMSVTCERPLDGVSAAQKLNSQSFDLVLVDCENLPAAKLIFDVCRRGKAGNNPVPIAIVDGRAGLPTAFRLGAELILTKPVAKDQARTTIRAAVNRVRKDSSAAEHAASSVGPLQTSESNDDHYSSAMGAATGEAVGASMTGIPLDFSTATVGDTSAPQLTSYAEPMPTVAPAASVIASPALASSALLTSAVSSAAAAVSRSTTEYIKEAKAAEKIEARPKPPVLSEPKSALQGPTGSTRPALVMKPSDDPVLAELELTEKEAEQKKIEIAKSGKLSAEHSTSRKVENAHSDRSHSPETHEPIQRRRNVMLVGTLMLALAGGGVYAVWNYQPGFKAMAQAEINRALGKVGVSLPQSDFSKSTNIANAPAAIPVDRFAMQPNAVAPTSATQFTADSTASPESPEASAAPATALADSSLPESAASQEIKPSAVASAKLAKASVTKSESSKLADTTREAVTQKSDSDSASAKPNHALILSSQGAQKRLLYSVQPKYSAEERARGTQGSIVLKTLVKSDGNVADVHLVEGSAAFAPAAIEAVKQWRYRPLQRQGMAQPFQTVVVVEAPKQ